MTRVAILWHMHQPFYQDLVTGEHILPWVRLHALKDYYGMVALLREFPDVRMTFNLVPSLLVQIESFAGNEARDRHLELGLKPAELLSDDERAFCVEEFFHAHRARMIDPYPRYAELYAKRGAGGAGAGGPGSEGHGARRASQFSVEELRDLQVWHKLVWLDPFVLDNDPRVAALIAKERGFSEDDKATLRTIELELLRSVIPEYRDAARRGQVELSTSPFYHPILPLLCDSDVYLRTHPHSRMPRERFRHPDDALEQLTRAVAVHERLFGQRPNGVWPSEGSVSDAVVPLVAKAGFRWMATDEEILARTLARPFTRDGEGSVEQPETLYHPYSLGLDGESVGIVFRDHTLSDLIGFTYSSWSPDFAAADFVRRLEIAGRRYTARTGREATISIILDGENAWEYFEGGGRPFLRALYGRLSRHRELQTVTMSEATVDPPERLPGIFPGSWINGDFYIWIGHEDDRRAWSQLADARTAWALASADPPSEARDQAREELLIAEGSDWFWWYGDDHSAAQDLAFDDLFRRHVRNVYRALGQPIPEELFVTNITTAPPALAISAPTGLIHPVIDGEVTSYFEWVGAGVVELIEPVGAMHQVSDGGTDLLVLAYGFDLESLYLRIEAADSGMLTTHGVLVTIEFLKPARLDLRLRLAEPGLMPELVDRREGAGAHAIACPGIQAAAASVLEVRIPFGHLGVQPHDATAFMVAVQRGTGEPSRYPRHQAIEVEIPDASVGATPWTA